MKRFLETLFLLILILFLAAFIILRLLAQGSENNFFNQKYRSQVTSYAILRNFLAMHDDGDAKSDYLGPKYNKIFVELDAMAGLDIPDSALDLLQQRMSAITGKEVIIVTSDNISYMEAVSDEQINEIVKKYRNNTIQGNASIYLLYLSRHDTDNRQIGLTYKDFGVLVFDTPLHDFTQNTPDTFSNYLESTALHEFGHQLGLDHNNLPGCLMNPDADTYQTPNETAKDVITDFCDYEKAQIRAH